MSANVTPLVRPGNDAALDVQINDLVAALERDGAVALPQLVSDLSLQEMKEAFESRLTQFGWNDATGYTRTELKRLGVTDVLTLAQGFVDIGVHPLVTGVMERYIGKKFALAEAKGWQTQRSLKDFHGWHGDAWYDQSAYPFEVMPREVKLAFYLTDVNSGAFQYVRGSHRKEAPRLWPKPEGDKIPASDIMEFKGKAGTAMIFDTSGIHRQGIPVLDPRRAVFYNYHDLDVKLQKEDVDYYRYHPLILNAAFLGGLTAEQQRVLGFGHKGRFQHDYIRSAKSPVLHKLATAANAAHLYAGHYSRRVTGKIQRMLAKK